ncbi:hypothetical protein RHS01_11367 [Rhizoctonia solani]|uniref:Uncharacterized protein n=1 Tax=Rhizoctonia solani TaxID=456999 RepID=A0A8H7I1R7_9AGAM|nr:hypothetical protein RHS01_11367 [Rhizoctonia solani]
MDSPLRSFLLFPLVIDSAMWAAAARDVSSQSPPPPSERHLSITDSIASTTVEEIKERYRLSTYDHPNRASNGPPRLPHARRDSIFSFNTNWTGDEAFSISDFPPPPAMIPRFGPAIASSVGHLPPTRIRTEIGTRPIRLRHTLIHSAIYILPSSRPVQCVQQLEPPSFALQLAPQHWSYQSSVQVLASVRADSVLQGQGSANLSPKPTHEQAERVSPTIPSPSSQYLVPSPSSAAYTRTLHTHTQHSPTDTATGTYTTTDPVQQPRKKFLVSPLSSFPCHRCFSSRTCRSPKYPHLPRRSLEPGFIRSLMRGIERDEHDGFSLEDPSEGRLARFLCLSPRFISGTSPPVRLFLEDLRTRPRTRRARAPTRLFSTRPAASLPSSPRSSFSLSVRSGVTGRAGWGSEAVPEVPRSQTHFDSLNPSGVRSSVPPRVSRPRAQRRDGDRHRRNGHDRRVACRGVSPGGLLSSPVSPNTLSPVAATAMMGQPPLASPLPVSPLTRAPSTSTSIPYSYNGKTSPIPYAGRKDLGSAHVRTTSRDLTMGSGGGGDVVRRGEERSVVVHEEDGDELVYVRGEDVDRERAGGSRNITESRNIIGNRNMTGNHNTTGTHSTIENRNTAPGNRATTCAARDTPTRTSTVRTWRTGPIWLLRARSPRAQGLDDQRYGVVYAAWWGKSAGLRTSAGLGSPSGAMHSPSGLLHSPGGLLHSPAFPSPGGSLSTPGTPFRPPFATPSSAPATPGHGHGPASLSISGSNLDSPRHAKRASGISFVSHQGIPVFVEKRAGPPMPAVTVRNEETASNIVRKEGTMELPQLAHRAERLNEMLELGKLPHRSKSTLGVASAPGSGSGGGRVADVPVGVDQEGNDVSGEGYTDEKALRRTRSLRSVFTTLSDRSRRFIPGASAGGASSSLRSSLVDIPGQQHQRFNKLPEEHRQERKVTWGEGTGVPPPRPERTKTRRLPRKRLWTLLAIAGPWAGTDAAGYTCPLASQTGQLCDLDATCACTSSLAGQCNPLAQVLVDLVGPVNKLFDPSPAFTPSSVALSLWEIQGSPLPGANCANQADLVDVGPALSAAQGSVSANRTEFARSALLWTLVMTMSPNSTERMQQFVKQLDFTKLEAASLDSSVHGEFLFGAAGYQIDFARMTVSQPAITWQSSAKPSTDQVALVSEDLRKALDRVYTFATASSAQRSSALARYWTNTLQFTSSQLSDFRRIASVSPVLLPFDATSSAVRSLFSNVNGSFPPLLRPALFPRLNPNCFSSRPVYGVLDIARLRSSFGPSEKDAPKQAVQVAANATSRVSVRLGRDGAGLPLTSVATANLTGSDDARTFGTISNMDHVLLTYLQAFPSIQAAGALIDHVLASSDLKAPPRQTLLRFAFFGTVGPVDLASASADFASPSGELFFGSSAGDAFREWAVQRTGEVVWYDGAAATQVVREGRTRDSTFEDVWKGANGLLSNAETTGVRTSRPEVARIVNVFTTIGYMGS